MKEIIPNNKHINIENKTGKKSYDSLSKPIIYTPKSTSLTKYKGENVKIGIIDSGCPTHKDIKITGEKVSFCNSNRNMMDYLGHATSISGIIGANNKSSIIGLAPQAQLYYAKVVNDDGKCCFNSLIAAVLWSLAKEVDIIVLALGTKFDYTIFKDTIKKAVSSGVCIFAAAGKELDNGIDYPARYPGVLSVSSLSRLHKNNHKIKEKVDFNIPYKSIYTTHLNNKYIKTSGSSIATAWVAGLAALLIEKYKKFPDKIDNLSKRIHSDLLKII
jgi:minor extracellular protease Epr